MITEFGRLNAQLHELRDDVKILKVWHACVAACACVVVTAARRSAWTT